MDSILRLILFWLLLLVSCGYALWRGRKYERIAALVFVIGNDLVDPRRIRPCTAAMSKFEASDLIVDTAVLFAVIAIALVSDRFWPLWVAGLQLVDSMSHLMKAIDADLLPTVYGAAERFWSYPILLILFIGAWRQRHRPNSASESLGTLNDIGLRRCGAAKRPPCRAARNRIKVMARRTGHASGAGMPSRPRSTTPVARYCAPGRPARQRRSCNSRKICR